MSAISFRALAEACAPAPEDVELYRNVWNYHVWGYSAELIADTLQQAGYATNAKAVRQAIHDMKARLEGASYKDLATGEVREYLALNAIAQQELMDLFTEARNDFALLRRGQVRRADGGKVMQVTAKDLMSMLQGIERLAQNRAAVLTKMAEERGSPPPRELPEGPMRALEDLVRTPESEVLEAEFEEV